MPSFDIVFLEIVKRVLTNDAKNKQILNLSNKHMIPTDLFNNEIMFTYI